MKADATGEPVLEIRGLSVSYGMGSAEVKALQNVDLTLRRGEVLGLAGESGSGKSTLVYGATRLLSPPGVVTAGEVIYHAPGEGAGVDILRVSDDRLRELRWSDIALVFQGSMNSLSPVFRIERQLTDAIGRHRPGTSRAELRTRAKELLSLVGIPGDRLSAYPHQLSGGMRQRVMIAMAMALQPDVVIMDEPTTALDVVMQRQILQEILRLRTDVDFSVIFITHDVSLLIELADRIAIMYGGRIVEEGPAHDIYRNPQHPYTHGLLNSFPSLHGERKDAIGIPGSPPDLQRMPPGCPFDPRCAFAFEPCHSRMPPLEESETAPRSAHLVACHLHAHAAGPLPISLQPAPTNRSRP
ncbi:ABC transporter ATP-binding protein [Microbacterium sp. ET2]|uniref:ABC transporter ATP-binding protein n=1 Tax=Microbacterium albipurpureum TaxID=3050384 RepID=UPI00259CABB6|nr:ABC transporter ATP-binding protein [Microbacterium sp. ET2 (Ac-2212)]WJL97008.1 ABC transporter ATP-binding protein [Microbacterium sp. ET2 (Ac-2212)]